jgi:beta-N-acetylhexosaminidase
MSLGPLMVDIAGTELTPEDIRVLSHPLVGSVILFTRNYLDVAQVTRLTAAIRAVRTPHLLIAVDHEGGRIQRFRALRGCPRLVPWVAVTMRIAARGLQRLKPQVG